MKKKIFEEESANKLKKEKYFFFTLSYNFKQSNNTFSPNKNMDFGKTGESQAETRKLLFFFYIHFPTNQLLNFY